MRQVAVSPTTYVLDPIWGELARLLVGPGVKASREPLTYRTWGQQIDRAAHAQMETACRVPSAVAAALMPDAHVGYGLPIGGVLACEGRSFRTRSASTSPAA